MSCPAGQPCSNQACALPCNATTCGNGCCDGATCVNPTTDALCGLNGGACSPCASPLTCRGGICQTGAGGGAGGTGGGAAGAGGGGTKTAPEICFPPCGIGKCCDITKCLATGAFCTASSLYVGALLNCTAADKCQ